MLKQILENILIEKRDEVRSKLEYISIYHTKPEKYDIIEFGDKAVEYMKDGGKLIYERKANGDAEYKIISKDGEELEGFVPSEKEDDQLDLEFAMYSLIQEGMDVEVTFNKSDVSINEIFFTIFHNRYYNDMNGFLKFLLEKCGLAGKVTAGEDLRIKDQGIQIQSLKGKDVEVESIIKDDGGIQLNVTITNPSGKFAFGVFDGVLNRNLEFDVINELVSGGNTLGIGFSFDTMSEAIYTKEIDTNSGVFKVATYKYKNGNNIFNLMDIIEGENVTLSDFKLKDFLKLVKKKTNISIPSKAVKSIWNNDILPVLQK